MTTQPQPLPELIAQHIRLSADIDALDAELEAVGDSRQTAEAALRDASERERHASAQAEQQLSSEAASDGARVQAAIDTDAHVREARALASRARTEIEAADTRDRALMKRRATLERARLDLKGGSLADVQSIYRRIDSARAEVAALAAKIAAHQSPAPSLPDLHAMNQELAALLASVELGEAKQSALEALEKRRALAIKDHAKVSEEAERSALLVSGLRERLEASRATLADLEEAGAVALAWYGRNELTKAANEYSDAADQAFNAHGRMIGLFGLVQRSNPVMANDLSATYGRAIRQTFTIQGVGGSDLVDDPARRAQLVNHEVERLRTAGVNLSD